MLVTDKFIVLNFPKTGSSFVRQTIKEIYEKRNAENLLRRVLVKFGLLSKGYTELLMPHRLIPGYKDQHGAYKQIPDSLKDRRIVSVVRNPYSRFISQYHFKWWANNPLLDEYLIEKYFPKFPNLSLDDYVEFRRMLSDQHREKYGISKDIDIGDQTIHFVYMFFKEPEKVFANMKNEYLQGEHFIRDIAEVEFLRQENLNEELANFLMRNGFRDDDIKFASQHHKINITPTKSGGERVGLTKKAIDYVNESERFLFKILSSRGINYSRPRGKELGTLVSACSISCCSG